MKEILTHGIRSISPVRSLSVCFSVLCTGLFLADRFAPVLTVTSLLGGIYMNALNMMIFPLVFCSVVMGICSIGNIRTTGSITGSAMVFFLCIELGVLPD